MKLNVGISQSGTRGKTLQFRPCYSGTAIGLKERIVGCPSRLNTRQQMEAMQNSENFISAYLKVVILVS